MGWFRRVCSCLSDVEASPTTNSPAEKTAIVSPSVPSPNKFSSPLSAPAQRIELPVTNLPVKDGFRPPAEVTCMRNTPDSTSTQSPIPAPPDPTSAPPSAPPPQRIASSKSSRSTTGRRPKPPAQYIPPLESATNGTKHRTEGIDGTDKESGPGISRSHPSDGFTRIRPAGDEALGSRAESSKRQGSGFGSDEYNSRAKSKLEIAGSADSRIRNSKSLSSFAGRKDMGSGGQPGARAGEGVVFVRCDSPSPIQTEHQDPKVTSQPRKRSIKESTTSKRLLFLVMGKGGAGKSTFINLISGSDNDVALVGNGMTPCTTAVTGYVVMHRTTPGLELIFVDTPGLSEDMLSDRVLADVSNFLRSASSIDLAGAEFGAILWIEDISLPRAKLLDPFLVSCLQARLRNRMVVLASAGGEVPKERVERRARALSKDLREARKSEHLPRVYQYNMNAASAWQALDVVRAKLQGSVDLGTFKQMAKELTRKLEPLKAAEIGHRR